MFICVSVIWQTWKRWLLISGYQVPRVACYTLGRVTDFSLFVQAYFIIVNSISLCFFHLLYSANILCLLLYLYLIRFYQALLLFLCMIFTVLSKWICHGMCLLTLEFLLFFSVLHFLFKSILFFVNWISLYFFHLLSNTNKLLLFFNFI